MNLCHLTFPERPEHLKTLITLKHAGLVEHEIGTGYLVAGSRLPEAGESRHPRHEVSIILSGHLRTTVDGKEMDLLPGDIVSIPTGTAQHTEVLEDTKLVYIFFDDFPYGKQRKREAVLNE